MRILWLGHNLAYPPKGGPLQRNYHLLREAAKQNEVHALTFDQPNLRPPGVTPQDCVQALLKFCAGVDWVPLPKDNFAIERYWRGMRGLVSGQPYEFCWLQSAEMAQRIEKLVECMKFDVVHFDTLGLAQYAHLFSTVGKVLNHHDIESALVQRRALNTQNFLWRTFWRLEAAHLVVAERRWCPSFEVNVVVSQEEADILKPSVGDSKMHVVPNGVDAEYFSVRPDPGGKTLLFCGRLDQAANNGAITYFFDAIWPLLSTSVNDVEIYVVGKNPPTWLVKLCARDRRVHVPGFVDDIRTYFRKATLFVCPIKDGGGTRLKILDALAMGVPIVSTTFAASGLDLKDRVHLSLADTPAQFVERILEFLSNKELREFVSREGASIAREKYSWNVIGRKLEQAYKNARI